MITKAQKLRVILFISVITIFFLYILFLLIGKRMFEKNDTYFIKLEKQSVTGVNIGQDVKYYGIGIGKVTDIAINTDNISQIILTINIKKGTPIKETVIANMSYIGITGLKAIELTGGENEDKDLPPGSYIIAGKDLFDNITGKAEVITEKIEMLLNNLLEVTNQENRILFTNLLQNLDKTVAQTDTLAANINDLLSNNKKSIASLIVNTDRLMLSFNNASNSLNRVLKKGENILSSQELAQILANIDGITTRLNTTKLDSTLTNMNNFIANSDKIMVTFDKTFLHSRKSLLKSVELLKETLENFNEFAILLRENPDILLKGKEE